MRLLLPLIHHYYHTVLLSASLLLFPSIIIISLPATLTFAQPSQSNKNAGGDNQGRTFEVRDAIDIHAPIENVFCFAGNLLNDPEWRAEVNDITAQGPWSVGTLYTESSILGFNPNYVTITELVVLEYPVRMTAQTLEGDLFLEIDRVFQSLDDSSSSRTRFTYILTVDERLIKEISGFALPIFLVQLYYRITVHFYLANLRNLLESRPLEGMCTKPT